MTQEFVTLPRYVAEQAQMWIPLLAEIAGLDPETTAAEFSEFADGRPASEFTIAGVITALRAALEQPQNHVPDAGNMVPAGWKLVPVEPTEEMLRAGCGSESPAMFRESLTDKQIDAIAESMPGGLDGFLKGWGWRQFARAVLEAAPQPPTTVDSSVVQLQGKQQPVAEVIESHVRAGLDGRFTAVVAGRERLSVGAEIFVHPQLQREPLTRERIRAIQHELSDTVGCSYETMARAIEAAHNIK